MLYRDKVTFVASNVVTFSVRGAGAGAGPGAGARGGGQGFPRIVTPLVVAMISMKFPPKGATMRRMQTHTDDRSNEACSKHFRKTYRKMFDFFFFVNHPAQEVTLVLKPMNVF